MQQVQALKRTGAHRPTASRAHALARWAALYAAIFAGPVLAQQIDNASSQTAALSRELPLWEAGMGISGLHLPHYRGSDQTRNWFLPLPYLVYRGEWLKADREGARAVLLKSNRVQVDLSVAGSAPASSQNNHAREGMPDLKGTVEFGPNVNLKLWQQGQSSAAFRMPVRAAFTLGGTPRHIGYAASPYLTWETRSASAWDVGVRLGALFGDRSLHAYTYDVQPQYSRAGRETYRAGGGFAGLQATLGASKRMGPWWLGAFVRADSLAGAVFEGSPLVRSRQQLTTGLAVSYVFASSSQLVTVRE